MSGPRCAVGPQSVTFKIGPPRGDPNIGFSRMNTHTLASMESSEQEKRDAEAKKKQKRHGTTAKGSLAPILAQDENFEAPYSVKLQLQIWQDALKEELKFYRSVVIASEVLLQRVASALEGRRQPNLLATATALTVWNYFLPLLGVYEDLAKGVVEELTHAIYIAPAKSFHIDSAASAYARLTFFDSFFGLAESYNFHRERASKFRRMAAHEGRVLDRAVDHWQRSYAKKLLANWRGYTFHAKKLRDKYKRVFQKANSGLVVRTSIRMWRRHAHVLRMEQLASANSKANEQLRAAHRLEREAKDKLKQCQEESKRKERMLQDATTARAKLAEVHKELTVQVALASNEYLKLRKLWIGVTTEVFGDAHTTAPEGNYVQWAIDKVSKKNNNNKRHTHSSASARSHVDSEGGSEGGNGESFADDTTGGGYVDFKLNPTNVRSLLSALKPTGLQSEWLSLENQDHLSAAQIKSDDAERAVRLFEYFTGGSIPSPIQPHELVRGDLAKIRFFILTLMELYSGGFCSAFFPNHSNLMGVTPLLSLEEEETSANGVSTSSPVSPADGPGSHHRSEFANKDHHHHRLDEDPKGTGFQSNSSLNFSCRFVENPVNENTLQSALRSGMRKRSTLADIAAGRAEVGSSSFHNAAGANEGSHMTLDWNDGTELLKRNSCCSNRQVETLAELTQFGEVMQLEQQGQRFFDFASTITSSGQIPKDILVDALNKFVPEEDLEVAIISYPAEGISTISELVSYATDIAALISKPPAEALRLMEESVEISEAMTFIISTKDNDVQLVLASFEEEIGRVWNHYSKPGRGPEGDVLVMQEYSIMLFMSDYKVPCLEEDVKELLQNIFPVVKGGLIDRDCFSIFLCALASVVEPNPFVSLHSKLKGFLREILG